MKNMTDLDTSSPVVWPKWCYSSSQVESEAQDLALNNNTPIIKDKEHAAALAYGGKNRTKKPRRDPPNGVRHPPVTQINNHFQGQEDSNNISNEPSDVKCERLSPETGHISEPPHQTTTTIITTSQGTSPTPSGSPKSPNSHRTRTPSFPGTPPNPAFTPPTNIHPGYDRFSPAGLGGMPGHPGGTGSIKQMESLMNRNYSELMRSLAARYNNSNPNDYFSNPSNGFFRGGLGGIQGFKNPPNHFLGNTNAVPPVSCPPPVTPVISKESEKKPEPPVTVSAGLPPGLPPPGAPPLFSAAGLPGFPTFPLVDVSSTQVLINMVRNASSATQQSQLENYLRGAMKRPADNPASPLDLSASVGAKRPRTDSQKGFDMKSLFHQNITEEEKKCDPYRDYKSNSSTSPPLLKARPSTSPVSSKPDLPCSDKNCGAVEATAHWTVEDVCSFVASIDLCAEYVEAFREQRIDGAALPLLTEEHLTSGIKMKLGPALKLRSVLARRLGACNVCLHCDHCHTPSSERRSSPHSGQ